MDNNAIKTTPYYRNDGPNGVLVCHRQLDGPIPDVCLFNNNNTNRTESLKPLHSFFNGELKYETMLNNGMKGDKGVGDPPTVDLIVSGAIGYGAMYQNVPEHELSNPVLLPRSSSHDR
jgi:hypothetical protein